jgi:hypothetical protein
MTNQNFVRIKNFISLIRTGHDVSPTDVLQVAALIVLSNSGKERHLAGIANDIDKDVMDKAGSMASDYLDDIKKSSGKRLLINPFSDCVQTELEWSKCGLTARNSVLLDYAL